MSEISRLLASIKPRRPLSKCDEIVISNTSSQLCDRFTQNTTQQCQNNQSNRAEFVVLITLYYFQVAGQMIGDTRSRAI